jgi:hypothetical protein
LGDDPPPKKRGPGRPRKKPHNPPLGNGDPPPKKRGPGRPPKTRPIDGSAPLGNDDPPPSPKRGPESRSTKRKLSSPRINRGAKRQKIGNDATALEPNCNPTEKFSDQEVNEILGMITAYKTQWIPSHEEDWNFHAAEAAYVAFKNSEDWVLCKICKATDAVQFWHSKPTSSESLQEKAIADRLGIQLAEPSGHCAQQVSDSGIYVIASALCDVLGEPALPYFHEQLWRTILTEISNHFRGK